MQAKDSLKEILEEEKKYVKGIYPSNDTSFLLIEIIRSLDYNMYLLNHDIDIPQKKWLMDKYKFGWGLAFSTFYEVYKPDDYIPLFAFNKTNKELIDEIIQHCGSIQTCYLYLDFCKANLMSVEQKSDTNFTFYNETNEPKEYYERLSLEYYFSIMNKILEDQTEQIMESLPSIRLDLQKIVNLVHGDFISYQATEEMDLFYSDFGYLYLNTTQIIDDFDGEDEFGGIKYKEYLNFVQEQMSAALMHRDCCMALAEKTAHKVFMGNILTYAFSKRRYLNGLSEAREIPLEKLQQIISCFTINKENIQYHLKYPGAPPSPFFELGNDTLMRSSYGCLNSPVFFLNRELKRRYEKDYFNAVNNRELRFRNQLYDFFPEDRIIKVERNIIIKNGNESTDIDAILFDKERKNLALFQLKWQDSFSTSIVERYSRITNLIPKSVEWIDKVERWIHNNDAKSILRTLMIEEVTGQVNDIYLFVISRNHVHFSNQKLDERAIWSSWFQVIEAQAKIKSISNSNPLGDFAARLKFFNPEMRRKYEQNYVPDDFDFKFSKYNISIKSKKR